MMTQKKDNERTKKFNHSSIINPIIISSLKLSITVFIQTKKGKYVALYIIVYIITEYICEPFEWSVCAISLNHFGSRYLLLSAIGM